MEQIALSKDDFKRRMIKKLGIKEQAPSKEIDHYIKSQHALYLHKKNYYR